MARTRLYVLLAVILTACRSPATETGSTAFERERSDVVSRANAALRRPGKVMKVVGTAPGNVSWTVYIAADGTVVSDVTGSSAVSSLDDASSLPYLFLLTRMDGFKVMDAKQGSQRTGVVVSGRYHLGDSSGCRTENTVALDPSFLPIQWTSKSCDGTVLSFAFTCDLVEPASLPAEVARAFGSTG